LAVLAGPALVIELLEGLDKMSLNKIFVVRPRTIFEF
jgi:hypothetical protein